MMPAPILTTTESTPTSNGVSRLVGASPRIPTTPTKFPGLNRANTLPHDFQPQASVHGAVVTDRTRLAPEDAIYMGSPPHKYGDAGRLRPDAGGIVNGSGGSGSNTREGSRTRGRTKDGKERGSRSRGRKAAWKKLLWVKQSCKSFPSQAHSKAHRCC